MSVKSNRSSNPGQNPGEKNFASHRRKLPRSLQEWPNPLRYLCENKSCHQSVKFKWDFLMRAPSVKEFLRFFWKGNKTGCPAFATFVISRTRKGIWLFKQRLDRCRSSTSFGQASYKIQSITFHYIVNVFWFVLTI